MRLVIGLGGESASDSSLCFNVLEGRPVVGMRDLAPEGLSAASDDPSPLDHADVLKRFQKSGDHVVAMLTGYRGLGLIDTLAREDSVAAMLVFEDPAEHIARRVSAGGDLSDAAKDWIKISTKILRSADKLRGSVRLFSAADIASAPQAFSYHCENELGIRLEAKIVAAPLIERLIAENFAAAHKEIGDLKAELLVRCESFGAPHVDAVEAAASALERLRSLYDSEMQTVGVQKDNALLKEQLRLAQYKAETYYRAAQAYDPAAAAEAARLRSELNYARHEIVALKSSMSWKISAPLRIVSRAVRRLANLKALVSESRQISMLKKSDLFDAQWYLKSYPDVAALRIDPARHYLRHGAKEGRSPSAKFDSRKYLKSNPDVAATSVNPLIHYLKFGRSEARKA